MPKPHRCSAWFDKDVTTKYDLFAKYKLTRCKSLRTMKTSVNTTVSDRTWVFVWLCSKHR